MKKEKYLNLLEEYKALAGNTDDRSEKRKAEIAEWFETHREQIPQSEAEKFLSQWLGEVSEDVRNLKDEVLRSQMSEEMHRLIPMGVVARDYFGKSAAWLSQRINGTPVRGKTYTLSPEQKKVFNGAMQDLAKKFGSFRLA